jgi:hypothetical protein
MKKNQARRSGQRKDPQSCSHSRLLEDEYTDGNERTGNFICRECGTVVPDPRPDLR